MAPLVHEFTYQAMAFDLLSINDGDKITYRTNVNEEDPVSEEKDMEITDKDKIWVENRHRHMKDTLDKLVGDFHKFIAENPQFTNQDAQSTQGMSGLNQIKDMIAGLPQFQEMKEAYSLHLTMASKCMEIFQHNKLPDLASVEQVNDSASTQTTFTDIRSASQPDSMKTTAKLRTWLTRLCAHWIRTAFNLPTAYGSLPCTSCLKMAFYPPI